MQDGIASNTKAVVLARTAKLPVGRPFLEASPSTNPMNPSHPGCSLWMVDEVVSTDCTHSVSVNNLPFKFNAMLLRLYFDGNDEIAWHTDGRTFLGNTPTIASLSFGANATFQMRRMTNVWPPLDGSKGCCCGIDKSTPQRDFVVGDGDMLVMRSTTQKHWHHRVPKQKGGRRPRLNINFRYIITGPDAERGQKTYYKYMVHGDEQAPKSLTYSEIMAKRGGMMNYFFTRPLSEFILSSNNKIISTDDEWYYCEKTTLPESTNMQGEK